MNDEATMTLAEEFGGIDIYLFDQLLRGRIAPGMRILDAGCGNGRNLVYLMRQGFDVYGVDASEAGVAHIRQLAAALAPHLPQSNFRVERLEAMSFPDAFFDVILSNAVLHFANSDPQFHAMLLGMWRVLRPGGLLFCRLASNIGASFEPLGGRRHLLPDGSEWYLVDEPLLMGLTHALGAKLVDPLKTTVVQGARCMTTWVVRKPG